MRPRDMIDELVDSAINLSDDPESGVWQINEAFKRITGVALYTKEAIFASDNLIKRY